VKRKVTVPVGSSRIARMIRQKRPDA